MKKTTIMGFIVAAFFIAQATNVFACNPGDPGYPGNCDDYVFTFSATDNYYAYNNSGCSGSDCDNETLASVGESQLFVSVSSNNGQVNFEFQNWAEPNNFEYISLYKINFDGDGIVNYSTGSEWDNDGGSGDVMFNWTDAGKDSLTAVDYSSGLDQYWESQTVEYDYAAGENFISVIDALNAGSLSIDIWVKGFGCKMSFVNNPCGPSGGPTPIPEPATMLLLGTGLAGIAGTARRRKKTRK